MNKLLNNIIIKSLENEKPDFLDLLRNDLTIIKDIMNSDDMESSLDKLKEVKLPIVIYPLTNIETIVYYTNPKLYGDILKYLENIEVNFPQIKLFDLSKKVETLLNIFLNVGDRNIECDVNFEAYKGDIQGIISYVGLEITFINNKRINIHDRA